MMISKQTNSLKAPGPGFGAFGRASFGLASFRHCLSGFALLALVVLSVTPASAAPMKCNDEQQACITACGKGTKTALSSCVTACGASQAYCKKTGCWINGAKNYCGLSKL